MEKSSSTLIYKTTDNGVVALLELSQDMSISEFHDACARLALAAGYHPNNVSDYFGDDDE